MNRHAVELGLRDLERRLEHLAPLREPRPVDAGEHARALRRAVGERRGARHPRRRHPHRPGHPVHAAPLRRRHAVDQLAGRVEDLELERADEVARALIPGDHRPRGRVLADELGVALHPAAGALHPLLHGPPGQERDRPREHPRGERAERREVVEDPDAAAVRAENEILRLRMHEDVVVPRRRQIRGEPRPVRAAVVGDEQRSLGAREQHVRCTREFGEPANRGIIGRQPRDDRRPRLPEVVGLVNVRFQIVEFVPVHRNVSRCRIERGCVDDADHAPLRAPHRANTGRGGDPRLTGISGRRRLKPAASFFTEPRILERAWRPITPISTGHHGRRAGIR